MKFGKKQIKVKLNLYLTNKLKQRTIIFFQKEIDSSIDKIMNQMLDSKEWKNFMNSDFPITCIKRAMIPVEYSIVLKNISVVDWRNLYNPKNER